MARKHSSSIDVNSNGKGRLHLEGADLKSIITNQQAAAHSIIKTNTFIKPANTAQRLLVKSIKNNDITIAQGVSGSGKTLISLFNAVQMFNDERGPVQKIIYVRANVDSEEEQGIGYLPGTQIEKLKPLAMPILDNLCCFVNEADAQYYIDSGKIEVIPLSMMRGRSFNNAFIIADELQNASPKAIKTLLTRLGTGSRMVLLGDVTQCDTKTGLYSNGLHDLVWRVSRALSTPAPQTDEPQFTRSVGLITFTKDDIIRHAMTRWVLDLYEEP